jgi:hypothetical protein
VRQGVLFLRVIGRLGDLTYGSCGYFLVLWGELGKMRGQRQFSAYHLVSIRTKLLDELEGSPGDGRG